ncbi:hypothetical protein JVU11DRAFT_9345 [Chiua virens]|nr:hypothetical protein JVU11DRAFT_9345 [Chiua virens]
MYHMDTPYSISDKGGIWQGEPRMSDPAELDWETWAQKRVPNRVIFGSLYKKGSKRFQLGLAESLQAGIPHAPSVEIDSNSWASTPDENQQTPEKEGASSQGLERRCRRLAAWIDDELSTQIPLEAARRERERFRHICNSAGLLLSPAPSTASLTSVPHKGHLLSYTSAEGSCVHLRDEDIQRLRPGELLNDPLIIIGMNLWLADLRGKDPAMASRIHIFDSHFYTLLLKGTTLEDGYKRVCKWTAKFDLFSREYVMIPICDNNHWYLAIICNLRCMLSTPNKHASRSSAGEFPTRTYILILDSLDCRRKKVFNTLRQYLALEAKDKHKVPKVNEPIEQVVQVPRQKNSTDCGAYLLHFAKVFMAAPSKVFLRIIQVSNIGETVLRDMTTIRLKQPEKSDGTLWEASEIPELRDYLKSRIKSLPEWRT